MQVDDFKLIKRVNRFNKSIWAILIFFLCLPAGILSAQSRLDAPTANTGISDEVPLARIRQIALKKPKEKWGHGTLGDPIPLSDLGGNIKAYMFSFHIGKDRFPSYTEIVSNIREARELRLHLQRSELQKAKELYKRLKAGHLENGNASPSMKAETRPDGSTPRRAEVAELREIKKFAEKRSIGAGEFGTIIVSATYNTFPVLAYLHYLAPYYYNFDLALEKAQGTIGQSARLQRIYFLGLKGNYFEFVSDTDDILLNAKSLERKKIGDIEESRFPASVHKMDKEREEAVREEIAEAWETTMREVEGE